MQAHDTRKGNKKPTSGAGCIIAVSALRRLEASCVALFKRVFRFVAAEFAGCVFEAFGLTQHYGYPVIAVMRDLPPTGSPFFIVYIDESGDPGLHKIKPKDENGASEWLTLGASLYHYEDEPKTVEFIRNVRNRINDMQGPDLHFRRLSDSKKLVVCQQLSLQPTRAFAVLSHKPNMKGYRNPAAEHLFISPRGWFYNWCIRLLLERVTDYAERYMYRNYRETRPIKLVFSKRGGVAYDWLKDYIEVLMIQSRDQKLHLEKRDIKHRVLDLNLIDVIPHIKSAGCQIADIVTSAMHCAADAFGPRWNIEPAKALRPILPTECSWYHDYSVTLQPSFFKTTRLTGTQKLLFEEYGYCFRLME